MILRRVVGCFDFLGKLVFRPQTRKIDWNSIRRVAVIRCDHIGDVILTSPFLQKIKHSLPNAKVDLWVSPWGKSAAKIIGVEDRIVTFKVPWLERPRKRRWSISVIKKFAWQLRQNHYDAVIDLRGDIRNLTAMWLSRIPIRIGQILTGGKFLLTHPVKFNPELHAAEQNVFLLAQIGLNVRWHNDFPIIKTNKSVEVEFKKVSKNINFMKPIIAIHPASEVPSKRWFVDNWANLIKKLDPGFEIVLLGGGNDKGILEEIAAASNRKVFISAGLFDLSVLSVFLKKCKLFIGLDSGPGHIAAAVGTPVISLFSGVAPPERWKPLGPYVRVLHKKTKCHPCDRSVCPFDNECMKRIRVGEVLRVANQFLK